MKSLTDKQTISIGLVGDFKQKQQFLMKARLYGSSHEWSFFEVFDEGFTVWPLLGLENVARYNSDDIHTIYASNDDERSQKYCLKELYNIKAIIYLNPLPNQKAFWEKLRDPSKCIAIECNAKNCNPKQYFHTIEKLIPLNQQSLIQFFKTTTDRSLLLLMSNRDKDSDFAEVPQEVIQMINSIMYLLAEKQPAKSIFQALRPRSERLDTIRQQNCIIQ